MSAHELEPLLKVPEVARYLNVAEQTLRQWVWRRRIPYLKLGKSVRFRRSELDTWMSARRGAASAHKSS